MLYAIGDIHGRFDLLRMLHKRIMGHSRKFDEIHTIVMLGDYVDRGRNSKQCVELLIQLQSEGATCLRGNHDDIVDFIINGDCVSDLREFCPSGIEVNKLNIGSWWLV